MSAATRKNTAHLGGEYPTTWKAFIGQDAAKEQLITRARSARARRVRLPHTLLACGQPGIGKTSLALLLAQEMRAELKIASGQITMQDARLLFAEMQDGGCLFIDEIHQVAAGSSTRAEWLLHYLQDGMLIGPLGPEKQPEITIIAATTEAGKLKPTILDRFEIRPALTGYTDEEATKIAQGMAKRIFTAHELPMPSPANCHAVAVAASCNPRVIRSILTALRDIALVHNGRNIQGRSYDLTEALAWLGLSADGLNDTMRRYLMVLFTDFAGDVAGQTALQDRLQEPGGLGETERLLMDKGLIVKSKAGRALSPEGIRRARTLVELEQAA